MSLALDRGGPVPMQVQLASQLRQLILSGVLGPGFRLPSSRGLAQDLSVSRVTVLAATDQLVSEGYAEARQGAGVYVAANLPDQVLQARPPKHTEMGTEAEPIAPPDPVRPFRTGVPDATLFPHRDWSRRFDRVWRAPEPALLSTADPFGWPPLRAAIADHLGVWRGITCAPQQIIVTSGAVEALSILTRAVFRPGDRVAVEEPGYRTLRRALQIGGLACETVMVDRNGFDVSALVEGRVAAQAAAITPSRHYPLGVTLPLARRLDLLNWARQTGGLIIEDDYDSEYRYQGRPLPALMSLDDGGRVVYIGSFSKVLLGALRLGFLVVPVPLVERARTAIADIGSSASLVAQPVLAEFMADGSFAAHIRRMRRIYARRQAHLIAAVMDHLSDFLEVRPEPAGMHLVAELKTALAQRMSDHEAALRAAAAGIEVRALSTYYAGSPSRQGLVLGYAAFDEEAIAAAVKGLAQALTA